MNNTLKSLFFPRMGKGTRIAPVRGGIFYAPDGNIACNPPGVMLYCTSSKNICIWVVDELSDSNMLLIHPDVLPDVYRRVVQAKRLLASGQAKSASDAARMSGVSRSAFYKYKDAVFAYNERAAGRIVTLHAVLRDRPGVLSSLLTELYRLGANILTVNQNIPVDGSALVSLSIRTDHLKGDISDLIEALRQVDGILRMDQVLGE